MTSPVMLAMTPDELLCYDRAMTQWEASLKRPDLDERDRVRGAIEAYQRQAFALLHLAAAQVRLAEEAEDEAKDCFWAIYPAYLKMGGAPISTEVARTALAEQAALAVQTSDPAAE